MHTTLSKESNTKLFLTSESIHMLLYFNTYLLFKLIHTCAVVVFLGNLFTGLFWVHEAVKTNQIIVMRSAFKSLIKSDKYFTLPSVIFILISGIATSTIAKHSLLQTGWIFWALVLFATSGLIFGSILVPIQRKLMGLMANVSESNFHCESFNKLYRQFLTWGILAVLNPIVALIMMIMKWPSNRGF